MEKLNKLNLPTSILIGCVILGGFYYVVQVNKQKSIEEQYRTERASEAARQELSAKQNECKSLSDGVRDKWSNVMGVTYDEIWGECVVTYTDTVTGKINTSALRLMKTVK